MNCLRSRKNGMMMGTVSRTDPASRRSYWSFARDRTERGSCMRLAGAVTAAIVSCIAIGAGPTLAQPASPQHPTEAVVTAAEHLDQRTVDLTIESPSVGRVKVRLLLPARYHEDPTATWPVLYLLHGATDDHATWTEQTDVADWTADLDLLVVMPDAGAWGWYSDWWNAGRGGAPAWETFHLTELRDIVERDWRASDSRMVAGRSMGGFGAMHYATAHPELFQAAASFSGALDPVGSDFIGYDSRLWGDRDEQAEFWAAHDPVAMAAALAGMSVYVSWQDGQPGPHDPPGALPDDLEAWVAPQNETFVARLRELGIPVTAETGRGTHAWSYSEQGLHHILPLFLEVIEGAYPQ
jgi:diacylglycerol O-acyltransferase / trehalose O-mycolyltransferase